MTEDRGVQCREGFTVDADGYEEIAPHKPFCPDCIPDLRFSLRRERVRSQETLSGGAPILDPQRSPHRSDEPSCPALLEGHPEGQSEPQSDS
jgi:hypothetical protein